MIQGSLPIFDGGERYANIKEAQSKLRSERLALASITREIDSEVRGRLEDIRVKKLNLLKAKKAVDVADGLFKNTSDLYRLGIATSLELRDSDHALFQSRTDLQKATLDLQQTVLALAFSVGDLTKDWVKGLN